MAVDAAAEDGEEPARTIQLVRRKGPADDRASHVHASPRRTAASSSARPTSPRCGSLSATGSEIHARSEEISEGGHARAHPAGVPARALRCRMQFASPVTGEMIQHRRQRALDRERRGGAARWASSSSSVPPVLRRVIADYIAMLPGIDVQFG